MSIGITVERRMADEAIFAKDEWLKVLVADRAVQHFVRRFIHYLDLQKTITMVEAPWDNADLYRELKGTRDCLQILIDELSRPLLEMEEEDERRARESRPDE